LPPDSPLRPLTAHDDAVKRQDHGIDAPGISFLRVAIAYCLALSLSCVPIFSTVLPPLLDYPNHLARMHVLAASGESPWLSRFYAVHWTPLPNLAMDLIVPVLATVMPLETAGKVFLVLIFALIAGGGAWLNRVLHGRWSYWSLSVFLLLYNRILQWGYVNYLFGLGVATCALALWLGTISWPAGRRVLLSSGLALAVYFSHISAFGAYALVVAGLEIGPALALVRVGAWRRLGKSAAIAGAQFILPAAILVSSWRVTAGEAARWGSLWRKAGLLFGVFNSYDKIFEAGCFIAFVGVLAVLAIRNRLGLAPQMRWPLLVVTTVYLAMPGSVLSGSSADSRMVVVIFLLILAGSAPRWPDRRTARLAGAVFVLLFAARLAVFEGRWVQSDAVYRSDIAALDTMPNGARLAVAFPDDAIAVDKNPELHLPTLAIIRRDAFVPTLFHDDGQQPVRLAPDYAALWSVDAQEPLWSALAESTERPPESVLTRLKSYDFIVFVNVTPFRVPPSPCLGAVNAGTTFQLFKINAGCAAWR
jgi:hypothetical protein